MASDRLFFPFLGNVLVGCGVGIGIFGACRIKVAEQAVEASSKKESDGARVKDADVQFQSKLNKDAFMASANSMAERLSVSLKQDVHPLLPLCLRDRNALILTLTRDTPGPFWQQRKHYRERVSDE